MSKKMTIAFETEDFSSEMLDKLFESFKEQENRDGLKFMLCLANVCLNK